MRKWSFWGLMCLVSLIHWLCFFQGTLEAFYRGIPGVDNQAALLFIPAFWVMAAAALIVFALWTLWIGRAWIERGYRFSLSGMIFFARRSRREKRWGAVFFLLTGVLVWRGLLLIHPSDLWTALYLVSGLVLFLLFYFWLQAGGERGVVVVQLMCALLACAVWLLLAGSWAASAPSRASNPPCLQCDTYVADFQFQPIAAIDMDFRDQMADNHLFHLYRTGAVDVYPKDVLLILLCHIFFTQQ